MNLEIKQKREANEIISNIFYFADFARTNLGNLITIKATDHPNDNLYYLKRKSLKNWTTGARSHSIVHSSPF